MAGAQIQPLDVVHRIFSNWTALRMAVEHGMGSQNEARNFCEYVAELLTLNDSQMHYTDVSAELEDYMDERFNTRLEDNSEVQVAQDLVRFHLYMLKKDVETLQTELAKLPELQPWIQDQNAVKKVESDSESDVSDEEMDTDDSNNTNIKNRLKSKGNMEVDEDGWSVVKRK